MREGDIFLSNDPYTAGGTHKNDINVVMPIFWQGELVMLAANKAHHLDIGGKDPGSWSADARNTYQEGLCLPALRLARGGVMNEELVEVLMANLRTPTLSPRRLLGADRCAEDRGSQDPRVAGKERRGCADPDGGRAAGPRRACRPRGHRAHSRRRLQGIRLRGWGRRLRRAHSHRGHRHGRRRRHLYRLQRQRRPEGRLSGERPLGRDRLYDASGDDVLHRHRTRRQRGVVPADPRFSAGRLRLQTRNILPLSRPAWATWARG